MKNLKLFLITSLDGFIATPDGCSDWIKECPDFQQCHKAYKKFLSEVDTIIMDGQTYRNILCMDVIWPFENKMNYIISKRHKSEIADNIKFIHENIVDEVVKLKKEDGLDIGLIGGGRLTNMLFQNNLINDTLTLTLPIYLGEGISLFPPIRIS